MTILACQGSMTGMTKKPLPDVIHEALHVIARAALFGTEGYSPQDLGAQLSAAIHTECSDDMGEAAAELDTLSTCRSLALGLMEDEGVMVRAARRAGATWGQVADVYCISRQAAWERFRD